MNLFYDRRRKLASSMLSPSLLFKNNEQGVWYDPSDIKLNWRRNLLKYSEQFDNAAWVGAGTKPTVTANSVIAPDGTLTADSLYFTVSGTTNRIQQATDCTTPGTVISIYLKGSVGGESIRLWNGWTHADITLTTSWQRFLHITNDTDSNRMVTFMLAANTGTPTVYAWGAQLEKGTSATEYQKITNGVADYYTYQPLPVLYQDAAGTIPVTAVEQPVGLMLDKSKNLALGPELVVNGGFDNGTTGWGVGAGWVVTTGQAVGTAATGYLTQSSFPAGDAVGTFYRISVTVSALSGNVAIGGGAYSHSYLALGANTYYIYRTLTSNNILYIGSGGGSCTITKISAQKLLGNPAYQATSANRPTLSARYNLLTYSEDFSNAVWNKIALGGSLISNVANHLGLPSAFFHKENTSYSQKALYETIPVTAGTYTFSLYFKANGRNFVSIYPQGSACTAWAVFNLLTGSIVITGGVNYVDSKIVAEINDWYKCSITFTTGAGTINSVYYILDQGNAPVAFYTGDGTSGVYIWGADLRPSNHGTDLPPYQRVTTNTDYDTVGFPPYLAFNGTNSSMVTNSIDFSATDKMSVWAGVRKLSDATTRSLFVFGTSGIVAGSFEWLFPPNPSSIRLECAYVGNSGVAGNYMQVDTEQAPASSVIHTSIVSNLRPYLGGVNIRYNGELKPSVRQNNVETSGNFGNFALTIGGRPTGLLFLGNIYSLIIRGAQSTDKQIVNTETWINKKIGDVYQ